MGSLPNLHELEGPAPSAAKCSHAQPPRITCLTRGHRRLQHTRSASHAQAHGVIHAQHHQQQQQGAPVLWDDFLAEHMASYSPVSSRSTRSAITGHHVILPPLRRRDSLSSSCGASSVRRLIAVVRSTPSRLGPTYSRRVLLRTFTALCLTHTSFTAAFLPLQALQASISAWFWSHDSSYPALTASSSDDQTLHQFQPNNNSGSLLFAVLYSVAAIASLFAPSLVSRLGSNWVLALGYTLSTVFFGVHLYPVAAALLPAYILMGVCLGLLTGARVACLMTLASKLAHGGGDDDDPEDGGKREVARRLGRALQAAQDLGMVLGNVGAAALVWFTLTKTGPATPGAGDDFSVLGALFSESDGGDRVCGREACPLDGAVYVAFPANLSVVDVGAVVLPCRTTALLASVAVGCAVMAAVVAAVFMDKIRPFAYQDPAERGVGVAALRLIRDVFRDPRLQLAAPLSMFIGLEQGFMYADFSKYYVMCSLGVPNISLVFLSMGLLQSVAGFTLSMLLQHIQRYLAIGVGFVFHACLLLVLLLWKPSGDDPALFYVISAAWGVCNAIWETLTFTFLVAAFPHSWPAPVAHSGFFRCLGLSLSFALHGALCNGTKLYVLAVGLVLAAAPFTLLETRLHRPRDDDAAL